MAFPDAEPRLAQRFFQLSGADTVLVSDPLLEVRAHGPVESWGADTHHWGRPFEQSRRPATWWEVSTECGAAGIAREADAWTLFTDSLGIHDVYVRPVGGSLFFCSRIEPLARLTGPLTMNPDAWASILVMGGAVGRDTPFVEIERLPAATGIRIDAEGARSIEYTPRWMDVGSDSSVSASGVADALLAALPRRRWRRSPPVTLSGGWDSRILAGLLVDSSGRVPRAWTTAQDDGIELDMQFAPAVARTLGMPHRIVRHERTGWPDRATEARRRLEFGTWYHPWLMPLVTQMHSAEREVVDGLAGDVLFKGANVGHDVLDLPDPASRARSLFVAYGGDPKHFANRLRAEVADALASTVWHRWRDVTSAYDDHRGQLDLVKLHARTSRTIAVAPLRMFGPELHVWLPFVHPDVLLQAMTIDPRRKADAQFIRQLVRATAPTVASAPSTNDPKPPPDRTPRIHEGQEALRWMRDLVLGSELLVSLLEPSFHQRLEDVDAGVPSDFTTVRVLEKLSVLAQWEAEYPDVAFDHRSWR